MAGPGNVLFRVSRFLLVEQVGPAGPHPRDLSYWCAAIPSVLPNARSSSSHDPSGFVIAHISEHMQATCTLLAS